MKIIDKRKDYYDYLQGIWGQDPKAVYYRMAKDVFKSGARPEFFSKSFLKGVLGYEGYIALVCGRVVHRIYYVNRNGEISMKRYKTEFINRPNGLAPVLLEWRIYRIESHRYKNKRYTCRSGSFSGRREDPMLMSFPLTVVPAEEVFTGIQDYLLSQFDVDIPDNRTDIQKLEAAGFDRRTSFRNIK